ncbi:MAG: DoxX family protein [Cyclobacteriaceae bacterium]
MMNKFSYLILRLVAGMSMLGHGLVRIPKLQGFSQWMVGSAEGSMLPEMLVVPFSYALPFIEFAIGVLLVCGLFTRMASLIGGFVMVALIFGTSLMENWSALPSQMIHAAFFAMLIQFLPANGFAVDNLRK